MKKSLIIFFITTLIFSHLSAGSVSNFSLKKLDGSTFRFADVKGKKIVVIDFWATWCKPCKKYMKKLQQIETIYKNDVAVIAVSIDDTSAFSKVDSYIKGKRFTFTVLLDPDRSLAKSLNPAMRVPFTLVIDKTGKIAWTHTGYMPGDERELKKEIDKLIKTGK